MGGTITPSDDSVTANSIADDAVESEHLNNNIISGQTALAANPATDDEFLISDAGTIKRIDAQFFQNTPSFEATKSDSNQDFNNATYTKLQFNSETFDSDGKYDNSTNYRFTPTIAGKYFIYAVATLSAQNQTDWNYGNLAIYKNGSEYHNQIFDARANPLFRPYLSVSAIIDFDSDDYVEIYARVVSVDEGTQTMQATNANRFGGFKIIGV